jgi:hypothetical protein
MGRPVTVKAGPPAVKAAVAVGSTSPEAWRQAERVVTATAYEPLDIDDLVVRDRYAPVGMEAPVKR